MYDSKSTTTLLGMLIGELQLKMWTALRVEWLTGLRWQVPVRLLQQYEGALARPHTAQNPSWEGEKDC